MQRSINHTLFFKHSPEDVWEYLTKAELIEQWLMKSDFLPVVGHLFQFTTKPMPGFNFNGIINCKVLEIDPLKKLVYSWQGGGNDGAITLDSVVEWTLNPKDGGTELVLAHTGFKEADVTMHTLMTDGWIKNVNKINDLISAKHDTTNA